MPHAIRRIPVLFCFLLLLLCSASAAEQRFSDDLCLRLQTLTGPQRVIYDLVYEAAAAYEPKITFPSGIRYDDVAPAMSVLLADTPELCGIAPSYSVSYYRNHPEEATGITLSYTLPSAAREALISAAEALTEDLPEAVTARAVALHDRICAAVTYDERSSHAHDAYGALVEGRAVCDGYTMAMTLVCRMAGIPAGMISGDAIASDGSTGPHSWNLLCLNGIYTQADVTWDDQPEAMLEDCFGLSDAMIGETHTRDEESRKLPACISEGLTWHALYGGLVNTAEEAWSMLTSMTGDVLRLRFQDRDAYHRFMDMFGTEPLPFACSLMWSDTRLCVTIRIDRAQEGKN